MTTDTKANKTADKAIKDAKETIDANAAKNETAAAKKAPVVREYSNGILTRMELSGGFGVGYGGEIHVPRLIPKMRIRLIENLAPQNENSPDFWLESPEWDNDEQSYYWERAGAAWIKTPKAGGDDFMSLNVDRNDMPQAVNVAAFRKDAEDQPKEWVEGEPPILWNVVYNRPRQNARKKSGGGNPSGPGAAERAGISEDLAF